MKIIWIIRCALRIKSRANVKFSIAIDVAKSLWESIDNPLSESPIDVADDELSYWDNDGEAA